MYNLIWLWHAIHFACQATFTDILKQLGMYSFESDLSLFFKKENS